MARNKKTDRIVRFSKSEVKKRCGGTNWAKILDEERMEKEEAHSKQVEKS